jgi:hypothetical protein
MEINTNNPVSNGVRESGDVKKISAVKQDNHPRPDQQAAQAEENPDYRISLSDKSKTSASRMAGAQTTGQPGEMKGRQIFPKMKPPGWLRRPPSSWRRPTALFPTRPFNRRSICSPDPIDTPDVTTDKRRFMG